MNYLKIINTVLAEIDATSADLSSISSLTGLPKQVARWTNEEYLKLCASRPFNFLERSVEFDTSKDKPDYSLSLLGIENFRDWVTGGIYLLYQDGVRLMDQPPPLPKMQWSDYVTPINTGRPTAYAIDPDDSLWFWLTPDDVYGMKVKYLFEPSEMSEPSDIPVIPTRHHNVLVNMVLMRYAAWDDAPNVYAVAKTEYVKGFSDMCNRYMDFPGLQYEVMY